MLDADYIEDQLRGVHEIRTKKMFGGFGLYLNNKFFGIISSDKLYFKTNEQTCEKYKKLDMKPFAPSKKQVLKNYYEVPEEIIENREEIQKWACESAGA